MTTEPPPLPPDPSEIDGLDVDTHTAMDSFRRDMLSTICYP